MVEEGRGENVKCLWQDFSHNMFWVLCYVCSECILKLDGGATSSSSLLSLHAFMV